MRKPTLNAPLMNLPFYAARSSISEHKMPGFVRRNEVALHLVLHGQVQVHVSTGQTFMIPIGHLAISWGAIPHRASFLSPRNELLVTSFPLAWFLSWNLPTNFTRAIMAGRTLFEPDPDRYTTDLPLFNRWCQDLKSPNPTPDVRRVVLLELEARINRLAMDIDPDAPLVSPLPQGEGQGEGVLSSANTSPGRTTTSPLPHPSGTSAPSGASSASRSTVASSPSGASGGDAVQKMITFIAQHAGRPLSVSDVAQSVNLHPDYGSRLFQRTTGTGLLDFINQHKVASAQGLLACTDAKVADIAHAAGFGSVSQFHAVFSRYAKTTPAGYRKANRGRI